MKKLFFKDRSNRISMNQNELSKFISNQILACQSVPLLIRWKVLSESRKITKQNLKTKISNRCVKTVSKKCFNKVSKFSRIVFLKIAKAGSVSGIRKSSW